MERRTIPWYSPSVPSSSLSSSLSSSTFSSPVSKYSSPSVSSALGSKSMSSLSSDRREYWGLSTEAWPIGAGDSLKEPRTISEELIRPKLALKMRVGGAGGELIH